MNHACIVQNFILILRKIRMTGHSLLKFQLFRCHQAVGPLGLSWSSIEVTSDVHTRYTSPSCTPSLGF